MIVSIKQYTDELNKTRKEILELRGLSDEDFINEISRNFNGRKATEYLAKKRVLDSNLDFINNLQIKTDARND